MKSLFYNSLIGYGVSLIKRHLYLWLKETQAQITFEIIVSYTGQMGWMAHRKWKETKQLPGTAGPGNMIGCCLIYFHFLWAIRPVQIGLLITKASKLQSEVRTRSLAVHPHLFWLSTPAYLIALGSSKI